MEIEQAFNDVALEGRNMGKFQYIMFIGIVVQQILIAGQMCLMVVLKPRLTTEDNGYIELADYECSEAASIFQVGVLFGNLIIGPVTDYYGRKIPFFVMVPTTIVVQVCGCFVFNKYYFFAFRCVSGMLTGTLTLLCFVYAQELLPKSVWAITGNVQPFLFAIGIAVVSIAGQVLTSSTSIILWLSVPFICSCVLVFVAPESPRWLLSRGKADAAADVFLRIAQYNGKSDYIKPELKTTMAGKKASMLTLCKSYLRGRTSFMMVLWFTASLCYYGLTLNLGSLHPNPNVSLCLSGLVEIPAYILCYWMMEHPSLGRKKTASYFYIGTGIASGLTVIAFWIQKDSIVLYLALIGKLCIAAAFTVIYVWAAELFPSDIRSNGMAVSSVAARLGGILAPLLPETFSMPNAYLFLTCFAILSSIASMKLPETVGKPMPANCAELERQSSHYENDREPLLEDM